MTSSPHADATGTNDTGDAISLVRRYYDAFNRRDWPAMLDLLADDVAHDINQGERQSGRDAFATFLARMHRCYRERLEDVVLLASADGRRVAAEYVVHGEYLVADDGLPAAHGQRYVLPGGAFFAIADGRIHRVTNYYNLAGWLAQVAAPDKA